MYTSLRECIADLEKNGHLIKVTEEVDPNLEIAAIQRRVYENKGPALLFTNVRGCRFPCVSNVFGTIERTRFIFRHTLQSVRALVHLKTDPGHLLRSPWKFRSIPKSALHTMPKRLSSARHLSMECKISDLPQIQCWPEDGGAFITLPQVYTENPDTPGTRTSNLGMYRVQLAGNSYVKDREVGLHYQIHRTIGVHHAASLRRGEPLRVSVFVGGPPAHTLAAIMPLPEGLSELMFAGALAGRRFRFAVNREQNVISTDADFVITGSIHPGELKPEGPFGDHLGYYSLRHDYPVLHVERVYHRKDAIWPFTVVGRPPQEDTSFGEIIHEITGPVLPTLIAGLKAVNAVDAAGVHPLLLAIGSERYTPFQERQPREILTIANALLGQGQLSLAKYVIIVAGEDDPMLDIHNIEAFLIHFLKRVDWESDLHFQTKTTMDTLDYSGTAVNEGSKVVMAAAGQERRKLATSIPVGFNLAAGFSEARIVLPGVVAVTGRPYFDRMSAQKQIRELAHTLEKTPPEIPLIVVCDDSSFTAASLKNFLWVTFTRSNPAADISGAREFTEEKHWGCRGPLIIDARSKPHHAPALLEDAAVIKRIERLGAKGGSLHGIV